MDHFFIKNFTHITIRKFYIRTSYSSEISVLGFKTIEFLINRRSSEIYQGPRNLFSILNWTQNNIFVLRFFWNKKFWKTNPEMYVLEKNHTKGIFYC